MVNMEASVLRHEAIDLISRMPASKIRTVIQFACFINHQEENRKFRDNGDFSLINKNASILNQGAEESLEFQSDLH